MSFYKRKFSSIILILAIFFITTNLVMFNLIAFQKNYNYNIYKPVLKESDTAESFSSNCYSAFDFNLSSLNAYNLTLNSHPECTDFDWVTITNDGILQFNQEYLKSKDIQIKYCEYQVVNWQSDDFDYELGPPVHIMNGSKLDLNAEFFHILCKPSNAWSNYQSPFARLFKKSKDVKLKREHGKQPINVFILGLDSVSSETWVKNLPKSSRFLINTLKSNVLKRYNIVGDGTPANLIPLLTSWHEYELPNTIKNTENSSFVDEVYPFIWNDFAEKLDYATMFGEDWPSIGTFHYRMKGFSKKPTTHYMRPFHLSAERLSTKSPPCTNGRTNFKVNTDFAKDFMNVYKDSGFFGFLFLNEYSHDSNAHLNWIDYEMNTFLEDFYSNKLISDNTVLILFSDHGARFSENRKSIRGLLEERNPFLSIYLPKLFKERYPNEYNQFIQNNLKLTTPMDIHKTLMHLILLESNEYKPENKKERSMSLFSAIPNSRTCSQASISSHWCACLKRSEIEVDSVLIEMANIFVKYLNNVILKDHLEQCEILELKNITRIFLLESSIDVDYQKKGQNSRFDFLNLHLLKPPPVEQGYQRFLFQIITSPNNAFFEFTIDIENKLNAEEDVETFLNDIKIDVTKISRIDKYGNSSSCIFNTFPDLRKYCYCRNFLI